MRYISTGAVQTSKNIGAEEVAFPTKEGSSFSNADIGLNNPGLKRIVAVIGLTGLDDVADHALTVRLIAGTNQFTKETCLYPTKDIAIPAGKKTARVVTTFDIALVNNVVLSNTGYYAIGIKSSNADDDTVDGMVMIYLDTVDVELVNGAAPEEISDYIDLEGSQGLTVDANGKAKGTGGGSGGTIYG